MDAEEINEKVVENYNRYSKKRGEQNLVKIDDEEPVELHRREIQEGTGNLFNLATDADREYLCVYSDEIPPFHEMPYEFLIKYPVNLTFLMRFRPLTIDHQHYWAWTAQVLSNINKGNTVFEYQLSQSIESLIRLLLSVKSPMESQTKLDRIADLAMNKHLKEVDNKSINIAAFNSYPVLEGLLKSICSDVITMDGKVRDGERLYGMHHDYIGDNDDTCSSIRDLLNQTENHSVEPPIKSILSDLRNQIVIFGGENHAYEQIYTWRNSLLHGQNNPDIQAGIITNVICVLIWSKIGKSRFEEQRREIIESVKTSQQMSSMGHDRSLYPP